jgi:hypothetical protein
VDACTEYDLDVRYYCMYRMACAQTVPCEIWTDGEFQHLSGSQRTPPQESRFSDTRTSSVIILAACLAPQLHASSINSHGVLSVSDQVLVRT